LFSLHVDYISLIVLPIASTLLKTYIIVAYMHSSIHIGYV